MIGQDRGATIEQNIKLNNNQNIKIGICKVELAK